MKMGVADCDVPRFEFGIVMGLGTDGAFNPVVESTFVDPYVVTITEDSDAMGAIVVGVIVRP